jgi:hypothetical protein
LIAHFFVLLNLNLSDMLNQFNSFGKSNENSKMYYRSRGFKFFIIGLGVFLSGCVNMEYQDSSRQDDMKTVLRDAPELINAQRRLAIIESQAMEDVRKVLQRDIKSFYQESDRDQGRFSLVAAKGHGDSRCIVRFFGEINQKNYDRFLMAVATTQRNNCKETLVSLNSPGGSVNLGMKMGIIIRKFNFYTRARDGGSGNPSDQCVSACTAAFLGGSKRFQKMDVQFKLAAFTDKTGSLLFHQPSRKNEKSSTCFPNATDPVNLLHYQYYKSYIPGAEFLLMGKLLNYNCRAAGDGARLTQDEKLWGVVHTDTYDENWKSIFQED